MAKIDELKNDVLWIRIAGGAIFAWLSFITWSGNSSLISLREDIKALKQSAKDHGAEIVQGIEHPKSTDQLVGSLMLASGQLQLARSEHRKPDPEKLVSLQNAIVKASRDNPDLPSTWEAAVQLVDYKFQSQSTASELSSLPDCLNKPVKLNASAEGDSLRNLSLIPGQPYRPVADELRTRP